MYASVKIGFILIVGIKRSSVAATSAAAAAGHTRTGSASLCPQRFGLTFKPFVCVLEFVLCFVLPNSKLVKICRRKMYSLACRTEPLVAAKQER